MPHGIPAPIDQAFFLGTCKPALPTAVFRRRLQHSGRDRRRRRLCSPQECRADRSLRHEASIAVIGGSRRQLRKIDCQVMDALGTEAGGRAPHILLCKRAIARSLGETDQLLLDISGPLAGKAGRRRVSLRGSAMAPGAIADGRTFAVTGRYRNGDRSERQDSDFQCCVFHGSSSTL